MKKNNYIIFALLPLLFSCAEHDDFTVNGSEGVDAAIEISSDIVQGYQTRVNDGGFVNGDAIGVYIVDYQDGEPTTVQNVGNHATNVKFSFNESDYTWTGSSKLYWTDDKTAVDAYSYYPFTEYIADVHAYQFSVERRQDKDVSESNPKLCGYEASDFLWAKAEDVKPKTTINLSHKHIMASVQIALVEGEGFDAGEWDGLEKSVIVTNTVPDAEINLETGTVSVHDDSVVGSITPYKKGDDWRCIVVPQTVEAGKTLLTITVDEDGYLFSRETAMTFTPGKLHKFTIRVDRQLSGDYQFSLVGEAVTAWETDDVGHQAEARVYTTIHVSEVGGFKSAVEVAGINPDRVLNLKLTGVFGEADNSYLKEKFSHILSLNMKELRFKQVAINSWLNCSGLEGWGIFEDHHIINCNEDRFDDAIPVFFANAHYSNALENLQHVILPDSLKYIGAFAFEHPPLTGRLEIPDGVIWIGDNAFAAKTITGLTLPNTVKYIGGGAFHDCKITDEIILPDGLLYLGGSAFGGCNKMHGQVNFPSSLQYIGDGALPDNYTGMAVLPEHIKRIPRLPAHINGVYIHDGVEEIADYAFGVWGWSDNYYLSGDIYIPNSVKKLGEGVFACSRVSHIRLPEGIEKIPGNLCGHCHYLQDTIVIPEGVIRIRDGAFGNCMNLTAAIIPSTVEIIDRDVFGGCYSLDYIECKAINPPTLTGDPFPGVAKNNFTLVVPEESVEDYQNAEYWREFKRISPQKNLVFRPQIAKVLNKGGKRDVVLNCDAYKNWTITKCPDWMHISQMSGTGKTQLTITIDAMEHGAPDRNDTIVVKMDGTEQVSYFKAYQFDYEYDEDQDYTIQAHTAGNGVDIVIVGDGYDAEDIARGRYLEDMMQEAEYFFGVEPFKTYREYFNVYTAFAMSYESGIGSVNYLRDTKFQTSYGNGCCDSRISTQADYVAYYCLDNTSVKEEDFGKLTCILTANGSAYDGVTTMFANGTAVAICPKSNAPYPNDARGLVQHEACGHGFGKLADEYVYHRAYIQTCPCICCDHVDGLLGMQSVGWGMNLSLSGKSKDLPWQHLLKDWRTSDIVDVWEGGYFHARGVYRSEYNSCMNNNVPYFSTWSRELIVRRIMDYAGEKFDFEDFLAKDSREWGRDFILGTKAMPIQSYLPTIEGAHPIIIEGAPQRNCFIKR